MRTLIDEIRAQELVEKTPGLGFIQALRVVQSERLIRTDNRRRA